jgi:hypothetical protein
MNLISYCLSIITIEIIRSESIDQTNNGIHIRIYDNIAEITRPILPYDLPMMFSQQDWLDIRSDSIRLLGNCLNIHAQIISFNQTSLNGQKILIKRNINNDTYTEGIMIDETRNLIQDLIDNTYYTLTDDRIRYLSIPYRRNYFVDFVLETFPNEQIYLRYLQTNIKWKVRYDLLLDLNDTDAVLQAYADIRNNGNSLLMIDLAELISGDINLQSSSNTAYGNGFITQGSPSSSISDPEELVGVYIFTINETFILDPQSNYILPMFRPIIDIERYGSIEKYFSSTDNTGNAQRAYRLRVEETYLPKGQVFIRESDRLVGELSWPDFAANETNEFNLGEDVDLQYFEYIQLNSRRNISHSLLSTYTIDLYLINTKSRSINFEYRLKFFSQNYLTLKQNSTFQLDGSTIIGTFEINANDEQQFQFTFETE